MINNKFQKSKNGPYSWQINKLAGPPTIRCNSCNKFVSSKVFIKTTLQDFPRCSHCDTRFLEFFPSPPPY